MALAGRLAGPGLTLVRGSARGSSADSPGALGRFDRGWTRGARPKIDRTRPQRARTWTHTSARSDTAELAGLRPGGLKVRICVKWCRPMLSRIRVVRPLHGVAALGAPPSEVAELASGTDPANLVAPAAHCDAPFDKASGPAKRASGNARPRAMGGPRNGKRADSEPRFRSDISFRASGRFSVAGRRVRSECGRAKAKLHRHRRCLDRLKQERPKFGRVWLTLADLSECGRCRLNRPILVDIGRT